MADVLKTQESCCGQGVVEVCREANGWYSVRVNGQIKSQSADLNFINKEANKQ